MWALRDKPSIYEPTSETPAERLKETWTSIMKCNGWEFNVFKSTAMLCIPSGFLIGYFSRSAKNKAEIAPELLRKSMSDMEFASMFNKQLNRANLKTAMRVGWRYAAIPIVLCGVTLSTISYRNQIYPLDFAASYGLCGALYFAHQGRQKALTGAAFSATFGLFTASILWFALYANDISVRDYRLSLSAEYNYNVEYRNRMKMYQEREESYNRMLLEREQQQMEKQKEAARRA